MNIKVGDSLYLQAYGWVKVVHVGATAVMAEDSNGVSLCWALKRKPSLWQRILPYLWEQP
jgi:hypothetical protein